MNINMRDVTIHLDETLGSVQREAIRDELLAEDGIFAAATQDKTPHLMVVEYDSDKTNPTGVLEFFNNRHIHAERLG